MNLINFFFIFGAEYVIYIMLFATLFLVFKGKTNDKKAFLLIILGIPISIILMKIIHLFYFEPRPWVTYNFVPLVAHSPDASFPSRHATISGVLAFSYLFFKSKWSPLFLITAVWVGISRVYVGVHYSWDVLGGFVIAVIALIISLQIKKYLQTYLHF